MKIVFDGKIDGLDIVIRYLESNDLGEMLKYINELSREKTFITYQGETVTEAEEIEFIAKLLQKMRNGEGVNLVVEFDGRIVGSSQIVLGDRINRHIGEFGIALLKDFRGKGLGSMLMKLVEERALDDILNLEIIILNVFAKNHTAKEIYKKFGFEQYGYLPNGVKLDDGYDDQTYMFKKVK